jgi:hypothetical protein
MDTRSLPVPGDSLATFYIDALRLLAQAKIPFLVGGGFACARYTKVDRDTKDLDILLHPRDVSRAVTAFARAGYRAGVPYPHWLAKVRSRDHHYLDLVFGFGNGLARVDDEWFTHAVVDTVLGLPLRLCPAEELLWSKAFIQERERFDGADVLHLLHACAATFDWNRLLARFGDQWPVLLSYLVLFQFVYPARRADVPQAVMDGLVRALRRQRAEPNNRLCLGTLLSREQYLPDVTHGGYEDARIRPHGDMTLAEKTIWTAAIKGRQATM